MPTGAPIRQRRAPRAIVGALLGAEAGAAAGLLFLGGTPLAPLGLALAGAAAGPFAMAGATRAHRRLVEHGIRHQLRRAHSAPGPAAGHVADQ